MSYLEEIRWSARRRLPGWEDLRESWTLCQNTGTSSCFIGCARGIIVMLNIAMLLENIPSSPASSSDFQFFNKFLYIRFIIHIVHIKWILYATLILCNLKNVYDCVHDEFIEVTNYWYVKSVQCFFFFIFHFILFEPPLNMIKFWKQFSII